jgi:hypothetical protein
MKPQGNLFRAAIRRGMAMLDLVRRKSSGAANVDA